MENVVYFDTHAHYDDEAFDADRFDLLEELHGSTLAGLINPGCDVKSSTGAMKLAERYGFVYFAAGIHPENIPEDIPKAMLEIEALLKHPKCVAVGEVGLDYYWDKSRTDTQKEIFEQQLLLAEKYGKPVIVHDREAHADCFEIIRRHKDVRGVFHCYSGSSEMAAELLKLGWYIGVDGPLTYKNARKLPDVVKMCPKDRLLIETDSPYLAPVPVRGTRNNSGNLIYIARAAAEIWGITPEETAAVTYRNAKELFKVN